MLGPPDLEQHGESQADAGVIPRAMAMIFERVTAHKASKETISEMRVSCSFIEIYQEEVQDLLVSKPVPGGLRVRETISHGAHIEGLTEHTVTELEAVWDLLNVGLVRRKTASTAMNETSSRSHSLFMVTVTQEWPDGTRNVGKLHLGDLAGSENVKKSQVEGAGLEEAAGINRSLSALGHCIKALTTKKRTHIPYRDSRLTFLLKESLGGNAKTTLIVTCSPHYYNLEETISTLRFAVRAKKIKNTAMVNTTRSVESLERLVESLTRQLQELQARVDCGEGRSRGSSKEDIRPEARSRASSCCSSEGETLHRKIVEAGMRSPTKASALEGGAPSPKLTGVEVKCNACARYRIEVRAMKLELEESQRIHAEELDAYAIRVEELQAQRQAKQEVKEQQVQLKEDQLRCFEGEGKPATASLSPLRPVHPTAASSSQTEVSAEDMEATFLVEKEVRRLERELESRTRERDEAIQERNKPSVEGEKRLRAVEKKLAQAEERERMAEERAVALVAEVRLASEQKDRAIRLQASSDAQRQQARAEIAKLKDALAESRRENQCGQRALEEALNAARGHDKTKKKLAEVK